MSSGVTTFTGQRIKQRRKQLDISQEDLAILTRISQKQISRYENGESDLTGNNLAALADALGTTADWLLGRGDSPKGDLTELEQEIIKITRSKTIEQQQRIIEIIRLVS